MFVIFVFFNLLSCTNLNRALGIGNGRHSFEYLA